MALFAYLLGVLGGADIISVDSSPSSGMESIRTIDSDTGKGTHVTSVSGTSEPIAVFFDADHKQSILLTRGAITTVDTTGAIVSTVNQPADGAVVSIGYNRNTTELFGIKVSAGAVSLVIIDRSYTNATVTEVAQTNATGRVKAAYYAWTHGHYCVVVESGDASDTDTMLFIDTKAKAVVDQHRVQPGLDIHSFAINYATRNVYALTGVNGTLWLAIVHMSGQLQQLLAKLPVGAFGPAEQIGTATSVVDNSASMLYSAVVDVLDGNAKLLVFDLAQNGTMVSRTLDQPSAGIPLVAAQ